MDAAAIVEALWAEGFTVDLAENDRLLVSPGSRLQHSHRELLLVHKPEVIEYLRETNKQAIKVTAELIEAAMRVCDQHRDGDQARAQMLADCLATLPRLRADLLDHFRQTYGTSHRKETHD